MRSAAVIAVLILALLAGSTAFVVDETQQVIKTQFGKPVGGPITEPGLNFKLPVIQKIHAFDKRFLEWDGNRNELPTRDKRFIWVDTYARWQITEPLLFFQRLRDERGAQSRLDDILNGETRNAIANHDLVELVRTSNRQQLIDESQGADEEPLSQIAAGREVIRQEILAKAQKRAMGLGIAILDVQFKRINYVEVVRRKVYDRMIAERGRIADRYRSEGEGEASNILGSMEKELKRIQSEAYRQAQEITGLADAEAASLYAGAYNKSSDSRAFYEFFKSMETLESTVDGGTWLVLSTEGDLYQYLNSGRP